MRQPPPNLVSRHRRDAVAPGPVPTGGIRSRTRSNGIAVGSDRPMPPLTCYLILRALRALSDRRPATPGSSRIAFTRRLRRARLD